MTANEAFNEYYKSLSRKERNELNGNLIVELEISPSTVENWRYSRTQIRPAYRREISRIIGKDIFSELSNS